MVVHPDSVWSFSRHNPTRQRTESGLQHHRSVHNQRWQHPVLRPWSNISHLWLPLTFLLLSQLGLRLQQVAPLPGLHLRLRGGLDRACLWLRRRALVHQRPLGCALVRQPLYPLDCRSHLDRGGQVDQSQRSADWGVELYSLHSNEQVGLQTLPQGQGFSLPRHQFGDWYCDYWSVVGLICWFFDCIWKPV